MEKKWDIFLKRMNFSKCLNFIWTSALYLKQFLDCGWTLTELKNQDWNWIAQYEYPHIRDDLFCIICLMKEKRHFWSYFASYVHQAPLKNVFPPGKMCWAQVKTIRHSLKKLGPSQKTLRHSWCPTLVTGLMYTKEWIIYKVWMKTYSQARSRGGLPPNSESSIKNFQVN